MQFKILNFSIGLRLFIVCRFCFSCCETSGNLIKSRTLLLRPFEIDLQLIFVFIGAILKCLRVHYNRIYNEFHYICLKSCIHVYSTVYIFYRRQQCVHLIRILNRACIASMSYASSQMSLVPDADYHRKRTSIFCCVFHFHHLPFAICVDCVNIRYRPTDSLDIKTKNKQTNQSSQGGPPFLSFACSF